MPRLLVALLVAFALPVAAESPDGETALARAVYRDDALAVEQMLETGTDVNVSNDYGVTPLHLACANRNSAIVRQLLDAGGNPNLSKLTGETPLMTCAASGAVDAGRLLLAHGADPNAAETDENQTALMWAVAGQHAESVGDLISRGADVNARSRFIDEPEPYVVDTPGLTVFGTNYPPTTRFREISGGFTALHFAAQQGALQCARLLQDAGADIDSPHPEYGSPLIVAIASGHEELAHYLLEQGADPNVKDGWGIAPLHYALHEGVLILNNFRPSRTDRFGWVRENMPELVTALLEKGADPNARIEYSYSYMDDPFLARSMEDPPLVDPVGATPLLLAAASGDVESMRILAGVSDTRARTIGGASAFLLAAGAGAERGTRKEKPALEAVKFALEIGAGGVDDRLTELAADGPAKGKADGRTALHFAASLGWSEVVRFIAREGAEMNAQDRYGMTPVKIALGDPEGRYYRQVGDGNYDGRFRKLEPTVNGDEELAELLVSLGAEPYTGEYRDRSGE
ncbi:MAG: ankyrin repeat domain-containing protein [Woeseiaceae bacterium]